MAREKLLTVPEVAEVLRVRVSTVQRHIRQGRLPAALFGRQYLVRESDLDSYVDALFAQGTPEPAEEGADTP